MQMRDGLAAVRAVIDDDPEAVGPEFVAEFSRHTEEMAEKCAVLFGCFADAGDGLARDDQQVRWRLRVDIPNGHAEVVLMLKGSRDFPGHDFLKEGHGKSLKRKAES